MPTRIADDFAAIAKRVREINPRVLGTPLMFKCPKCREVSGELTGEKNGSRSIAMCQRVTCGYRYYAEAT